MKQPCFVLPTSMQVSTLPSRVSRTVYRIYRYIYTQSINIYTHVHTYISTMCTCGPRDLVLPASVWGQEGPGGKGPRADSSSEDGAWTGSPHSYFPLPGKKDPAPSLSSTEDEVHCCALEWARARAARGAQTG